MGDWAKSDFILIRTFTFEDRPSLEQVQWYFTRQMYH